MAIWQWNVDFTSRENLLECFSGIPLEFDEELLDSLLKIESISLEELKTNFNSILSRNIQPWMSNDVLSWGHEDENDLTIIVEDSIIEGVGCRFDTRKVDVELLKWFIDFANRMDFLFILDGNKVNKKKVIEPKPSIVFKELANSRAMLFTKNPKAFFADKEYLDSLNSNIEQELDE